VLHYAVCGNSVELVSSLINKCPELVYFTDNVIWLEMALE